ncbi:Mis12 protein-domain-containing protein [Durotheca rogersii]|uniref:Mis12 protein-domain-containing protein n=1 Tax=Durotheca rogersii TaxID=419775 RepID=UPI00221F6D81|nr:Mis12 protein-domain-containing protein [Durotheca rogersii]KAI5863084.1 Mis12 protein-domain-containing protein [Durotheca rogersii]
MTTSANSDTELLTEHFGYPPVSLIDDIINSINILAERALNSVEQGLLNAPPASLGFKQSSSSSSRARDAQEQQQQLPPAEAAKMEIESGTHQLETLLCASIDRNFDKFEIYVLRNILCVRPADVRQWMRLSHYEGLDFSSPDSPSNASLPNLDTINHLRRKLRESMRLNALLTAERARNEKLLDELRAVVGLPAEPSRVKSEKTSPGAQAGPAAAAAPAPSPTTTTSSPFAFLHHKGDLADSGSDSPLSTTTAFALSQVQALRALSVSLRNLGPDLLPSSPTAAADDDDDEEDNPRPPAEGKAAAAAKKSWRRERLEYVEGAARRYLERVEGLELGRQGELRDGGEWVGAGAGPPRGEAEGLEGVVAILGGGADDAGPASASVGGGGAAAANNAAAARGDDRMDES